MKKYTFTLICNLFLLGLSAQCVDNGNYWNESWVSCTTAPNPNSARGNSYWILYEFHEAQYIDSSHFWNANRAGESGWGAKDVVIDYSTDGTSWTELGTFVFPQADESSSYEGFPGPSFNDVSIQKILITILSTHDGGSCASLAEVKFNIDQTACYGIVDACGICDGPGALTWYVDADNDGLGNPESFITSCTQPAGYVPDNSDLCDDGALSWVDVSKLFTDNGCLSCHGAGTAGGLNLTSYTKAALGGNKCGPNMLTGDVLVSIITIDGYAGCGQAIDAPSMNDRVGGAFDANELALLQAWIDGGAPEVCTDYCAENKIIATDYPSGAIIHQKASNQIRANNVIQLGSNVIYDAGFEIYLDADFEVEQGADFWAKIGGCGVPPQQRSGSKK